MNQLPSRALLPEPLSQGWLKKSPLASDTAPKATVATTRMGTETEKAETTPESPSSAMASTSSEKITQPAAAGRPHMVSSSAPTPAVITATTPKYWMISSAPTDTRSAGTSQGISTLSNCTTPESCTSRRVSRLMPNSSATAASRPQ